MNYLKELNAFYQQIIFNPLSGSAVALWNTLMHFNNLCGWQETFSVAASVIELQSGIKGTSFKRARDELQEKGYIHVTSRSGNQAAVYRMISQFKLMDQSTVCTEQVIIAFNLYHLCSSFYHCLRRSLPYFAELFTIKSLSIPVITAIGLTKLCNFFDPFVTRE
ncbi:hypothetical protein [Virgibacillus doumboii]|uniref:hypothetical protein n=1 Tax=Virgibacillus doumboii TaxID=2697503 RepID=UPI001FE59282|nr:hypothetical protein [Virgibacillus doumboii]